MTHGQDAGGFGNPIALGLLEFAIIGLVIFLWQ
jgi:hypothetical protein